MLLYRSRSVVMMPQVKFLIYDGLMTDQVSKNLSISKTFRVESSRTLINFTTSDGRALRWRAPWASILHETFHEGVDQLLSGITGRKFAIFLYCVSSFPGLDRRNQQISARGSLYSRHVRYAVSSMKCEKDPRSEISSTCYSEVT